MTEAIQYIGLLATFEDYCVIQERDLRGHLRPKLSAIPRYYSVLDPVFLNVMFEALAADAFPQTQLLSVYICSQALYWQKEELSAEYKRIRHLFFEKDVFNLDSVMHGDGMTRASLETEEGESKTTLLLDEAAGVPRLITQMLNLLARSFELQVTVPDRSKLIYHILQAISNVLTLNVPTLNTIILGNEALLPLMRVIFDKLFTQYDAVNSSEEYIELLDAYTRLLRNIVTIGVHHERLMLGLYERMGVRMEEEEEEEEEEDPAPAGADNSPTKSDASPTKSDGASPSKKPQDEDEDDTEWKDIEIRKSIVDVNGRPRPIRETYYQNEKEKDIVEQTLDKVLGNLDLFAMVDFMLQCCNKLVDSPRFIEDHATWKTRLFDSLMQSYRTVFAHQDTKMMSAPIDWTRVERAKLEFALQTMHDHRLQHEARYKGLCIDEVTLYTLYCMVKMGFLFQGVTFPDTLQKAGYGPGNESISFEQREIAAVCVSILSSTSGKNTSTGDILNNIPKFIQSLRHLKDTKQTLWHFKLVANWSKLPKVVEQVAADDDSYEFVMQGINNSILYRHSILVIHNLSALRPDAIQEKPPSIRKLCELYANLVAVSDPGLMEDNILFTKNALWGGTDPVRQAEVGDPYELAKAITEEESATTAELNVLSRLVLASVRNVIYAHVIRNMRPCDEIDERERAAIYRLRPSVNKEDVPFYVSILFMMVRSKNIAVELLSFSNCFDLVLNCMTYPYKFVKPNAEMPARSGRKKIAIGNLVREQLYEMDAEHMQEAHERSDSKGSSTGPAMGGSNSPGSKEKEKMRKDEMGLKQNQSLYQKHRQEAAKATMERTGITLSRDLIQKPSEYAFEEEYLFFMSTHIFLQATFLPENEAAPLIAGNESVQLNDTARESLYTFLSTTFEKLKLMDNYFDRVNELLFIIDRSKRLLTDLYLETASEFILHCLSLRCFQGFFTRNRIPDLLSQVAPFLLEWNNTTLQQRAALICIRASLHRQTAVCTQMAEKYMQFPELAAGLMTYAMVDPEAHYLHQHYIQFIGVFQQMLQQNLLSPLSVSRVAIATTTLVSSLTAEDFEDESDGEGDETVVPDLPPEEEEEESDPGEESPGGGEGGSPKHELKPESQFDMEKLPDSQAAGGQQAVVVTATAAGGEKKKEKKSYNQLIEKVFTGSKLLRSTLLQKEYKVWGAFLEELSERGHVQVIKKCMSLLASSTAGNGNYRNFPELDDFILGMMSYMDELLRFDFDLIFPILIDLALVGGKRVQSVMFSKKVHIVTLKRLEAMLTDIKAETDKVGSDLPDKEKIEMLLYRCRWVLYLFSIFLTDREAQFESKDPEVRKDQTFDSFARHDFLPVVIRYMKEQSSRMQPVEMHFCIFFLSLYGASDFIRQSRVVETIFENCSATLREEVKSDQSTAFDMMSRREAKTLRILGPAISELKNAIFLNVIYIILEQCRQKPSSIHFPPAMDFLQGWRKRNERFIEVNVTTRIMQFKSKKKKKLAAIDDVNQPEGYNRLKSMGRYRMLLILFYSLKADKETQGLLLDEYAVAQWLCNLYEDYYNITNTTTTTLPKLQPRPPKDMLSGSPLGPKRLGEENDEIEETEAADPASTQKPAKDSPTQYNFDQRLIWIRTVCNLLQHNAKKLLDDAPKVLEYAMMSGFALLDEYNFSKPALVMAIECLNIILPTIKNVFEYTKFRQQRKMYVHLAMSYICSAINLPLRVKACTCLEQILEGKVKSYDEVCQLLMINDMNVICWRSILRGTKEELTIATVKVMINFVTKGGHRARMYLLEGAMLPEVVSGMMAPLATQQRVFLLAKLFCLITTELDFDMLSMLIATTPDIKPFLGLARSSHENRRELVQKWIEFYGNSMVNFQDIYDAFANYGTLNGTA